MKGLIDALYKLETEMNDSQLLIQFAAKLNLPLNNIVKVRMGVEEIIHAIEEIKDVRPN